VGNRRPRSSRRHLAGDRRVSQQARAGYTGDDRRVCERRTRPLRTSEVLIAHGGNAAVIGTGVSRRRGFAQR
jgi:hypothetical protein